MRESREPKPLGDLMRALVDRRGWAGRMAVGTLRQAWPQVVGEQIASRSQPVKLQGGVLVLRVEPGAWASEITLLAATVASKADVFLGGGLVREVKVHAAPLLAGSDDAGSG